MGFPTTTAFLRIFSAGLLTTPLMYTGVITPHAKVEQINHLRLVSTDHQIPSEYLFDEDTPTSLDGLPRNDVVTILPAANAYDEYPPFTPMPLTVIDTTAVVSGTVTDYHVGGAEFTSLTTTITATDYADGTTTITDVTHMDETTTISVYADPHGTPVSPPESIGESVHTFEPGQPAITSILTPSTITITNGFSVINDSTTLSFGQQITQDGTVTEDVKN